MPIGSVRTGILGGIDAIPDSEHLQVHHKADEGVSTDNGDVTAWQGQGQLGLNLDTTNGTPTLQDDDLNGLPGIRFPEDVWIEVSSGLSLNQPCEVWAVGRLETVTDPNNDWCSSGDGGGGMSLGLRDTNDNYAPFSGNHLDSGVSLDTTARIFGAVFDGNSSAVVIDGAEEATGDAGSRDADAGWTIGARHTGTPDGDNIDGTIHEVMVYGNRDNDRRSDIISYLDSRYGIV